MKQAMWTLASLTPEQERLLKEAEGTLQGGALLAFEKRRSIPTELTPSQLQALQALEQKLGLVVVAVQP